MKRYLPIVLLIAVVFWFNGCDRKAAVQPSGKTIKVGIIAPFTGADRAKGDEGLKGIKTAMQLTPYLKNGDTIELVVEDDRGDPGQSLKALKKLAEADEVSAILTLSGSGPVLAMASIANDYKTPILALVATHPNITRNNQFVSQFSFDGDFQGAVAALYVRDELLIGMVAVFMNPDSTYSSHLGDEFSRKFESIGGQITDTVFLSRDADDYEGMLKRVRTKNPELIYLPIEAGNVISIIKEAKKMDWAPQIMGSDGLLSVVLVKYKDESRLLDGLLATDLYSYEAPLTSYGEKATSEIKGKPTTYAALGVEGYALLVDAMNRCNPPGDRSCINNMIRSTLDFEGIMGKISIGPDGKAARPLFINAIYGGKMKYIVKVY
jgi:branched-chain amino acid transport system substrate-binding protein